MATRKRTPEEAFQAIRDAELDDLVDEIDAMSPEEVDRYLEAHGGDAAGTARRGAAQMAALKERHARVGEWQAEARAKLDAARAKFAEVRAARPKLPREELLARLKAAESDARYTQPVSTFFRNRTTEEPTDAELEALLDEIEALRALEEAKGRGK